MRPGQEEEKAITDRRPRGTGNPHIGISMADVAANLGVSTQTVSRVLSNSPGASAETRARVLKEVDRLGYRPNRIAQSLATGQSKTIGVLITHEYLAGPSAILHGILARARESGYIALVDTVHERRGDSLRAGISALIGQGVAGVVLASVHGLPTKQLDERDPTFPLVGIGRLPAGRIPTVATDEAGGVRQSLEHLVKLGHRHVAVICGPAGDPSALIRRRTASRIAEKLGVPTPMLVSSEWSAAAGYTAGRQLVDNQQITAAMCANDQIAIGVISALKQGGRSVPDDISVTGFDDIPEAAYGIPSLTTIRQDLVALGREGCDLLLKVLDHQTVAPRITLPCELVVRGSTAPARS